MDASVQTRLSSILSLNLDSPELAAALSVYQPPSSPSPLPPESGLALGDSLRSQLEASSLSALSAFLDSHAPLAGALDNLAEQAQALQTQTRGALAAYHASMEETTGLVETAAAATAAAEEEDAKAAIAQAFLDTYQLTPEEEAALTAPALAEAFFVALERVRAIRAHAGATLRGGGQVAGLHVLEHMGALENAAYERLYRWVQSEGRSLDKDVAEIPDLLQRAVGALKRRPELFRYCFLEVASARHNAVVRGFLAAITRGGPSGLPRPIEVHAHDPLRYVGDMLAWLHQAAAWENELVSVLFADPEGIDHGVQPPPAVVVPESPEKEAQETEEDKILHSPPALLAHIFAGVCRTLQVRFEQALSLLSQHEPAGTTSRSVPRTMSTLFSLSNLLQFYAATLGGLMGEYAPLVECIGVCTGRAEALFQKQLKGLADALVRSPPSVPPSLAPPGLLSLTLSHLSEVMLTFSGSLVPESERELQFAPILELVLHPLIKACTLSAVALPPGDMAVYLLNCLAAMHAALDPHAEFTQPALELVSAQMDAHLETLVQEQSQAILSGSGILEKLAIAQAHLPDSDGPLSHLPGMSATDMAAVMRSFDALLSATSVLVMPMTEKLTDPRTRQTARARVADAISSAYTSLHDAVHNPSNAYGNPASILLHSPDELKILLR